MSCKLQIFGIETFAESAQLSRDSEIAIVISGLTPRKMNFSVLLMSCYQHKMKTDN